MDTFVSDFDFVGEQFLPELQVSLYSVAPTIGLHSTSMDELVYDVTLKFDTYPRGAGEQNAWHKSRPISSWCAAHCQNVYQEKNFRSLTGSECSGDARTNHRTKEHVKREHIFGVMDQILQNILSSAAIQSQLPGPISPDELFT